jgi:TonB family protein
MAPPQEEQNNPIAPSLVPALAGGVPPPEIDPVDRPVWLGRRALIAAALLHLLPVLLWLLEHLEVRPSPEVPAIEVTLVRPPQPAPPVQAEPPKIVPRESGADDKTEAKKTDKAEPALPRSGSPQENQPRPVAAEPRPPAPPAEKDLTIRLPQQGGTADRDLAGDAYLNHMMQMIERNRIYPSSADFNGPGGRLVIYSVVLEPTGAMNAITMLSSSGLSRIDEAARMMITSSAPFPPLPADYPQIRTRIVVEIPVYPRGR